MRCSKRVCAGDRPRSKPRRTGSPLTTPRRVPGPHRHAGRSVRLTVGPARSPPLPITALGLAVPPNWTAEMPSQPPGIGHRRVAACCRLQPTWPRGSAARRLHREGCGVSFRQLRTSFQLGPRRCGPETDTYCAAQIVDAGDAFLVTEASQISTNFANFSGPNLSRTIWFTGRSLSA
jgi:hypothetical protein